MRRGNARCHEYANHASKVLTKRAGQVVDRVITAGISALNCSGAHIQISDQRAFDSINLATSPRHSEHEPTSNKSPALTAPEKLAIVTS